MLIKQYFVYETYNFHTTFFHLSTNTTLYTIKNNNVSAIFFRHNFINDTGRTHSLYLTFFTFKPKTSDPQYQDNMSCKRI